MITAQPAIAQIIDGLLAAENDDARLALIARHPLTADDVNAAVMALIDRAEHAFGQNPHHSERAALGALALGRSANHEYGIAMAQMRYADVASLQGRNAEALDIFDAAWAAFSRLGLPAEAALARRLDARRRRPGPSRRGAGRCTGGEAGACRPR